MREHHDSTEDKRLAALKSYEILDTLEEAEFDDFTRLASQICGTPISLISLVDERRQWFKSKVGIDATETPRNLAFCARAIKGDGIMVVPNAMEDARFADNPLVTGSPDIRFYAGAPLTTPEGHAIGTLCVIDKRPRELDSTQEEALSILARQVVARLELRKSKTEAERLAIVTKNTKSAVIITDHNGKIQWVNPSFTEITEYRAEEVIGKKPGDFLQGPETDPATIEMMRKRLQAQEGFSTEVLNYSKSGREYWMSVEVQPLAGENGDAARFMAIQHDVTELRQAQAGLRKLNAQLEQEVETRTASLKRSESRFRSAMQNSAIGMALVSPNGRWLEVNDAICKIVGYSQKELLEIDFQSITHPDDLDSNLEYVGRILRREIESYQLEKRYIHKSGKAVWVQLNVSLARGEDGAPWHFVSQIQDITKRIESQRELHEKREMLRSVLENLTEGVVACGPDGELILFNKAAREWHQTNLLKVPQEKWSQIFELFEGDGITRLPTEKIPLLRAFRGKRVNGYEMSIKVKGQPPRFVVVNARPLYDVNREKIGAVAVMHDVTGRRKAEQQMLRTQRLESIGTLAGGVAHDLNNTLAPILMVTEILRLQYPEESQIIDTIEGNAKRGADMIRQLLTFARGSDGAQQPVDCSSLLEEMGRTISSTFPKSITLNCEIDADLPAVIGDATQLHQVLLNLCVNARDAMPNGGALSLSAKLTEIDDAYACSVADAIPGLYINCEVADSGTGMAPEVMERIFDPFFSTKGPDEGTGLGLSTLLGIVKSHNGFVRVYSNVGSGSTFSVYLPAAGFECIDENPTLENPSRQFGGEGRQVLVVDDDEQVLSTTEMVLTKLGFKVLIAADGTEALVMAAENRSSLEAVITDVHMPHLGGKALIRTLKRMMPEVGTLISSGNLAESERSEFTSLKVSGFLEKPFTQAALVEALRPLFPKDLSNN